jgi:hypothetical protein
MTSRARTPLHIALRVAAAVIGGYAFTWGFIALGVPLLAAAGMRFGDANTLSAMLGFLVLLVAFCWAFSAPSLVRIWNVLAGGGALMTLAGWWFSRLA